METPGASLENYASFLGEATVERIQGNDDSFFLVFKYKHIPLTLMSQPLSLLHLFTGTVTLANNAMNVFLKIQFDNGIVGDKCTGVVYDVNSFTADDKGLLSCVSFKKELLNKFRKQNDCFSIQFYSPLKNTVITKNYRSGVLYYCKRKQAGQMHFSYEYDAYGLRKSITLENGVAPTPVVKFNDQGLPSSVDVYLSGCLQYVSKRFFDNHMEILDEKGNVLYVGEYIFCKPFFFVAHGKGIQFRDGKPLYKGEFAYGLRSGKGYLYYKNGNVKYNGAWLNDYPHGNGVIFNHKGERYASISSTFGTFTHYLHSETVYSFCPREGFFSFFAGPDHATYDAINQTPYSSRQIDTQFTLSLSGLLISENDLARWKGEVLTEKRKKKIEAANRMMQFVQRQGGDGSCPQAVRTINVTADSMQDMSTLFDVSCLGNLESMTIHDDALNNVFSLRAQFLLRLHSVVIGKNACVYASLRLAFLPALRSIVIGENAFMNATAIVIENCVALETIHFAKKSFASLSTFELSYLPCLKTVFFGADSFGGAYSLSLSYCALLHSIQFEPSAFASVKSIRLESLSSFALLESTSATAASFTHLTSLSVKSDHNVLFSL